MWIEGPGIRTGWPERIAWASVSGGMLGLLLIGLLVWVERLEPVALAVASGPPAGPMVVRVEPVRGELRAPELQGPVSVPLSAVLRGEDLTPYCFVADIGGPHPVARIRALSLGEVVGRRVIVHRGLQPGEAVVVSGQHGVVDGDAVLVLSAPFELVRRTGDGTTGGRP